MEKTDSVLPLDHSGSPTNDSINSVNNSDQSDIPSSPNTQSSLKVTDPTESPKINPITEDSTTTQNEQQEEEEKEEESSDVESNLTKLSEEIDRFLTLLSSSSSSDTKRVASDDNNDQINPSPDDNNDPPPEIPASIENFLKLIEAEILNQDSTKEPEKWLQDSEEGPNLLQSIDRIIKLTNTLGEFQSNPDYSVSINRSGTVLQKAMAFLEDEFRSFLEDSKTTETESTNNPKTKKQGSFKEQADRCIIPEPGSSGDVKFHGYSPETVSNLNRIANSMISAGYESECCQVYIITRRHVFEDSLSKLGFEKISIDEILKMQWESLETEISTWIKTFKRCNSVHFPGELKLCESIFGDHTKLSMTIFSNLIKLVMIQLLNFAQAVAMTKRSAEKLFKFLDMYETLRDLIPFMDEIFVNESPNELKTEISSARCRLGESVVSIFCDLENSIRSDMGKQPVPGGAVHPLTRYTMNYLKYVCEYKETLEQVFNEHKRIDQSNDDDYDIGTPTNQNNDNRATPQSQFAIQIMNVMDLLDSNLDSKAKLYKDISLSYIFLMNNGRYIMQKIKGAEINQLMGDNWSRKRSSDLRQYHKNYQRETWSKVLSCFRDEGLQVNGKVSKTVLKERFKSFNSMFDEIHKTQSSWVVSDEQLQSELRVSISAVMIPAYRSFLGRFRQYLDSGRNPEKYIKYGPEDIETSIDELFDGNPASMVRRRT